MSTLKKINFDFSPYEEDIVIVGAKGRGKTHLTREILVYIKNLRMWVYDFQGKNFNGFGKIVHRVEDLDPDGYTQYVFQPYDRSYDTFIKFCDKVFLLHDTVIVFDEIHQYIKKQKSCPELEQIVMSKRNDGVDSIFISTVPQVIPNWILDNVTHCFAFPVAVKDSVGWLRGYMGEKAWLLLPPDKRPRLISPEIKNAPMLKQYGYLYRDMTKEDSEIVEP